MPNIPRARKGPRRGKKRGRGQVLAYPLYWSPTAASLTATVSNFKLDTSRPARISHLQIEYLNVSSQENPVPFNLRLYNAAGLVVCVTRPLLSSKHTPQFVTLRTPRGTDFGYFSGNGPIVTTSAGGLIMSCKCVVQYGMLQTVPSLGFAEPTGTEELPAQFDHLEIESLP